jgi:hypothetical protein
MVTDRPDLRLVELARQQHVLWAGLGTASSPASFEWCRARVEAVLADRGLVSVPTARFQVLLDDLIAEIARYEPRVGPIRLDTDSARGVPGIFGLERVHQRAPQPARLVRWPVPDPAELVATEPEPHVHVVVRDPAALVARHGEVEGLSGSDPVVVVHRPARRPAEDPLTLVRLSDPGQLDDLQARTGVPVAADVSLSSLTDEGWAAAWVPALSSVDCPTVLFDLPVTDCVDVWLRTRATIRIRTYVDHRDGRPLAVLALAVADEPPILCPTTVTSAFALATYVHRASGGAVVADDRPLARAPTAVRIASHHFFTDEPVIGPIARLRPRTIS